MNPDSAKSKVVPVVLIICATVIALSGIGAFIYVNQQSIDQKNAELNQQKVLKEKELEAQKESARIQAEAQTDAARCISGNSYFGCN